MVQIQGEKKECEIFSISLSIRGFHEKNPCIHVSYTEDSHVFFSVKKNSKIAKD